MNPAAAEWDKLHGKNVNYHDVMPDGTMLPRNRPCDWCGKTVSLGYIHDDCARKERDFYMDLLY